MILDENIRLLTSQYNDVIRNRLGIILHDHQVKDLIKVIHEACDKFHCTPEDYLKALINCPKQSPFLDHLIAGITINETYFFRDTQQMELLQNEILPALIKRKEQQNDCSLRIWSAGCASGEEIYSIAMLLIELIGNRESWNLKLLATDINTKSLQKGLKGIYSEWSMRSISSYFKEKYFQKNAKEYLLDERVKELVIFDYLNLNDESYPSIINGTNSQDLIICRNVLIYFDKQSTLNLMKRLNASLAYGGYLMLGASDPLNMDYESNQLHHCKGALFARIDKEISINSQETSIASIKIPNRTITPLKLKKKTKQPLQQQNESYFQQAIELANQGMLEEALKICEKGVSFHPTEKMNYFVYGLTLLELNKPAEAENFFRKALFLDNQFVLGHYQLGLLLLRGNDYKLGTKYLDNALKIAKSKNPEEHVAGFPGLSYQKLTEVLQNELKIFLTAEANHET